MKAVILAGGLGTRLSEETSLKPKPMVEIGGKPILWHIMKIYSSHGVNDFVICCGYKGYVIKEYFANYFLHTSDVTFNLRDNDMEVHQSASEPWRITLVDTGDNSGTGGRLKLVADHVRDETFCFTYGDGVSDVNVKAVIETHREQDRLATLTAVQPPHRFGVIDLQGNQVRGMVEKPSDGGWINGGFFVLEPGAIDYIPDALTHWEQGPMQSLAAEDQLRAHYHDGFWQPMDTLREKTYLEDLWANDKAPWKVWS